MPITIYRFHLVPISYRGRRHPEAALGVSEKGTAAAAAGGWNGDGSTAVSYSWVRARGGLRQVEWRCWQDRSRAPPWARAGASRSPLSHWSKEWPRGTLVTTLTIRCVNPVKLEKRRSSVLRERGDSILAKQLGGMALQRNPSLYVTKCQFSRTMHREKRKEKPLVHSLAICWCFFSWPTKIT